MFDTDEERLLTQLLHDIADVDRRVDPPADLERRVMAKWDTGDVLVHERAASIWRHTNNPARYVVAAAVVIAFVFLAVQRLTVRPENALSTPGAYDLPAPHDVMTRPPLTASPAALPETEPVVAARQRRSSRPGVRQKLVVPSDVVDFIPLGPFGPNDLSQSLQIIPVRIGNTPAEVLLGEDGMARAIRVSSSSSDARAFGRSR